MSYAIYNSKIYIANIRNKKVRLKTRTPEIGFTELIDLVGNMHNDIFIKEVSEENIEFAYELDYKVAYKGKEFEPWSIGKHMLERDQVSLFTDSENEAKIYGFTKEEQFVFKKVVKLDEIDALIEIKKPILKFKSMNEEKTRIEKNDIRDYIRNLID